MSVSYTKWNGLHLRDLKVYLNCQLCVGTFMKLLLRESVSFFLFFRFVLSFFAIAACCPPCTKNDFQLSCGDDV